MERVCTRCVRLSLRTPGPPSLVAQPIVTRSFTTSIRTRADDSSASKPRELSSAPTSQTLRITKVPTKSAVPINATPRGGQLLRRVSPSSASSIPRGERPPPGALLQRRGPPQSGQVLRRTGPPRSGGQPGMQRKGQGPPGKQRRRQTAESVKARESKDEQVPEEDMEKYITEYIDRPDNPTERIEYNPKAQDILELQKDWPDTPISGAGLSASLIQKIEWLARRIPHGHLTPEQLAQHFQKGNLTKFESEEEKNQVLKIAAELARQRASSLSERKGTEVKAEDMSFQELSSRDDKNTLINPVVKGEIGELARQRMPFLDSIMRNLRNNETYHKDEMDGFMTTIQRLMPASAQRRSQQQQSQNKA